MPDGTEKSKALCTKTARERLIRQLAVFAPSRSDCSVSFDCPRKSSSIQCHAHEVSSAEVAMCYDEGDRFNGKQRGRLISIIVSSLFPR